MGQKGEAGWPLALVVGIILLAVVLGFIILFSWNTTSEIQQSFGSLQGGVTKAGCALLGPLQGAQCGNLG